MDNYLLVPPHGGSVYNLGSWVDLNDGRPDFDVGGYFQAAYADNPGGDGGRLAFDRSGIRTFRFPLMLPSGISGHLHRAARPGAYVDLKLDGVPSAEMVRFDIVHGAWRPDHYVREWESGRTRGLLELGVQPFGYWPTAIVLASAASIGLPGMLAVPGASVIGDVPALSLIFVSPTTPTTFPSGSWYVDALGWSLAGRPSFRLFTAAASMTSAGAIARIGDGFAPGSQAIEYREASTAVTAWQVPHEAEIATAVEPAYRGRFRMFAFAQLAPSQPFPVLMAGDSGITGGDLPLASHNPVATLPPAVASGDPGAWGAQPSPAYTLLDLGDISLPRGGSGINHSEQVNVWHAKTGPAGIATTLLRVAGIILQPLDGPAGFYPRGLVVPSPVNPALAGRSGVVLDGIGGNAYHRLADTAATANIQNGFEHYNGGLPLIGPSTVQLDIFAAARKVFASAAVAASSPPVWSGHLRAAVSVLYRPRFTFQKTL